MVSFSLYNDAAPCEKRTRSGREFDTMTTAERREDRQSPGHVDSVESPGVRFWGRATLFWMVFAAFAVRLFFLLVFHTYRLSGMDDYCSYGEVGNIAASIAKGQGFSSPFGSEYTGPTAWIAPAYPYFFSLVLRIFGIMTQASTACIFVIQGLISALTVIPILGIANRTVGRRAGLWAAWAWILFPWFSKWSVTWIWETSLSALLAALLFWYALWLSEARTRKAWIGFGALSGFALLVNPALALLLPPFYAWCCYTLYLSKKEWLKPALLAILTCAVMVSPWMIRNRAVFRQWVFLRSNFGFELGVGNYHNSFGRGWGGFHPTGNPREYAKYKTLGEIGYIQNDQKAAVQFMREYPMEFMTLIAKRILYFWDGSAMGYRNRVAWYWVPSSFGVFSFLLLPALLVAHSQKLHAWQMFFGAILLYPLPYYVTSSQVRFRHIIEPLMVLLMAYAAVEAVNWVASFIRSKVPSPALSIPAEN
jgi:4-amino-4-deoxy-L-arabinose transferase-like glycosyltransferase